VGPSPKERRGELEHRRPAPILFRMSAALALALALAAATPAVVVAPAVARPGDAVLVRVPAVPGAPAASATVAGRPLTFWTAGDEAWALAALPLETPLGPLAIEIAAADAGTPLTAAVEIVEPGFPSRTLSVAPKFVEPPPEVQERLAEDRAAFAAAYDRPFSPPLFGDAFGWPRPARITGRFGDQRVFNGQIASVHYGVDLRGARGAPVVAANDGEVVLARDAYLSGKSVVLWHGAGVFTTYFHLDVIEVRPGARVKKGQRVGRVGSTGRSTGPHLHWSARVDGLFVDPESLLGIDFGRGSAPPRRAGPPAKAPPAPAETPLPAAEAKAGLGADPATRPSRR
jgi:hypothetical protein